MSATQAGSAVAATRPGSPSSSTNDVAAVAVRMGSTGAGDHQPVGTSLPGGSLDDVCVRQHARRRHLNGLNAGTDGLLSRCRLVGGERDALQQLHVALFDELRDHIVEEGVELPPDVGILHGQDGELHVHTSPAAVKRRELQPLEDDLAAAGRNETLDRKQMRVTELWRHDQFSEQPSHRLLAGPAEQVDGTGVPVRDGAVRIDADLRIAGRVDEHLPGVATGTRPERATDRRMFTSHNGPEQRFTRPPVGAEEGRVFPSMPCTVDAAPTSVMDHRIGRRKGEKAQQGRRPAGASAPASVSRAKKAIVSRRW
jgi:hypothetical protein